MRNLKCIGTGLGLAFLASVMMAMPAKAASNEYVVGEINNNHIVADKLDGFTDVLGEDDDPTYTKDMDLDRNVLDYSENLGAVKKCKLTRDSIENYQNDSYDEGDNIFSDKKTKAIVDHYFDMNYLVLDLGADYEYTGNYISDGENHYFDNGVKIMRSAKDERFCKYIFKCTYDDFLTFVLDPNDEWEVDETRENSFSQIYVDDDGYLYGYAELKYDSDKEIMTHTSIAY